MGKAIYRNNGAGYTRVRNLRRLDSPGSDFTVGELYTGTFEQYPGFIVDGNKIYYIFSLRVGDVGEDHIVTATSNLDGSSFVAIQQTVATAFREGTELVVFGNKVYYVWSEQVSGVYNQIFLGTSDLDGGNFSSVQLTTATAHARFPHLAVDSNNVYYVWRHGSSPNLNIYGGTSNLDGTNFSTFAIDSVNTTQDYPRLQITSSNIYYVWEKYTSATAKVQIWLGIANLDGSNLSTQVLTTSSFDKRRIDFRIYDNNLYYVWDESDGSRRQVWHAYSSLDGSGFTATQQTSSVDHVNWARLNVYADKIYYSWHVSNASGQVWTAQSNLNGTGFNAIERTTDSSWKINVRLCATSFREHYIWSSSGNLYLGFEKDPSWIRAKALYHKDTNWERVNL